MEWAKAQEIAPGLAQTHKRRDKLDDIDARWRWWRGLGLWLLLLWFCCRLFGRWLGPLIRFQPSQLLLLRVLIIGRVELRLQLVAVGQPGGPDLGQPTHLLQAAARVGPPHHAHDAD
jgi:hypothetical protein